nr:Conserved hypothetical protein [Methylocystis sp. SC2]
MNRFTLLFVAPLIIGAGLAGCGESNKRAEEAPAPAMSGQQSPPPAKTVSWFIEHRSELQATLKACRDNPGALGKTPDCVNASAARDKITVQEMKDALK